MTVSMGEATGRPAEGTGAPRISGPPTGPQGEQPARSRAGRRRGAVPVHVYFGAVVALALLAAVAGALYGWTEARSEARERASADAAFAAGLAADAIEADLEILQDTVGRTAASPGLERAFDAPGSDCALNFAGGHVFPTGHIDIIAADGAVFCTSRDPAAGEGGYHGEAWLERALVEPALTGPLPDAVTGADVVVGAVPISSRGVLAGFLEVGTLGPGLLEPFGGPRQLEFLVVSPDGSTALSRSVEPERWAGAPLGPTPFDPGSGEVGQDDVEGSPRLYGSATVDGLGWTVFAGADRAEALDAATRSFQRVLGVVVVGLVLTLGTAMVGYRGISRPVRELSRQARGAVEGRGFAGVRKGGAQEVVALGDDFEDLFAAVDRELVERQRAEELARASERNYRVLFDGNPQPMWVFDAATRRVVEVNDAAIATYGYSRQEFLAMSADALQLGGDVELGEQGLRRARHIRKDGAPIEADVVVHGLAFDGRDARLVLAQDVTERDRLERQLARALRLESLGQLAGGVAHDFNNLLTVMLTCATFIREGAEQAPPGDPRWAEVRDDVDQVLAAVERATGLTRQLLAFARREVVEPRVLDVTGLVRDLEQLLSRSIGEHVDLRTTVAEGAWRVKADPGQLEQVLVNLAVNARDAMPEGGTLAIDVDNVGVDEDYAVHHHGVTPGPYLRLRVSDTGTGMTPETVERAFEPFFTTKPVGAGTGLGLATVYGVVTQAGGHAQIYSEPGLGTTISVLLPATDEQPAGAAQPAERAQRGGGETILVVEDQRELREVTARILSAAGYEVLTATDGVDAVAVAEAYERTIDLLLTDVVMPNGLGGRETASAVAASRRGLRVLFMSGYAEPVLTASRTLDTDIPLLEKPFSAGSLLAKVRDSLDGAPPLG
ncbi:MAG: response regulator [Acidimicrobiia bacterium]|nr:response regulator [Acidimicrobiia bacterium]